MTRLVLAVLVVAAIAAVLAVVGSGLRATFAGQAPDRGGDSAMQKVAFALLVALIIYVAFQGSA